MLAGDPRSMLVLSGQKSRPLRPTYHWKPKTWRMSWIPGRRAAMRAAVWNVGRSGTWAEDTGLSDRHRKEIMTCFCRSGPRTRDGRNSIVGVTGSGARGGVAAAIGPPDTPPPSGEAMTPLGGNTLTRMAAPNMGGRMGTLGWAGERFWGRREVGRQRQFCTVGPTRSSDVEEMSRLAAAWGRLQVRAA